MPILKNKQGTSGLPSPTRQAVKVCISESPITAKKEIDKSLAVRDCSREVSPPNKIFTVKSEKMKSPSPKAVDKNSVKEKAFIKLFFNALPSLL